MQWRDDITLLSVRSVITSSLGGAAKLGPRLLINAQIEGPLSGEEQSCSGRHRTDRV
jgi:hypothetical protein